MKLAVSDIETDDVPGARLQQAVGEATGGLPDIEAGSARYVDTGGDQRAGQFQTAARDETVFRIGCHGQPCFRGQIQCCLGDDAA